MKQFLNYHLESSIAGRLMNRDSWTSTDDWPEEWIKIEETHYPRFPQTKLKADTEIVPNSLVDIFSKRRSVRDNTQENLSFTEVSTILTLSASHQFQGKNNKIHRRNYPSAGARYPIEIYLISLRCENLCCGVYHYTQSHSSLSLIKKIEDKQIIEPIFGHDWITNSRAIIILVSMTDRTSVKYGERSYRFSLLEAGHIMQNLCLTANYIDMAFCPVGGFADAELHQFLRLNDKFNLPLYAGVIP